MDIRERNQLSAVALFAMIVTAILSFIYFNYQLDLRLLSALLLLVALMLKEYPPTIILKLFFVGVYLMILYMVNVA